MSGAAVLGYQRGKADCEAAHAQDLLDQIEAGRILENARIEAARQRDALARQLEEAAYADPVVVHQCLGTNRVRRLNAIR